MKNQGKVLVTVYLPLILGWHIRFKQNLKGCLIQIRIKGTTELLVDVEVDGENTTFGWSYTSYVFQEAIKDTVYQVRKAIRDERGNVLPFSDWVDEINNLNNRD